MKIRGLMSILGIFLSAFVGAQVNVTEMRSTLALDLPPSWSYLAHHERSGDSSLLEIEGDAVVLVAGLLELDSVQTERFEEILEEYRAFRDRELETVSPILQKLQQSTAESVEADSLVERHLDQVSDFVTAILDYRVILENDFLAALTPAQAEIADELVYGISGDELVEWEPSSTKDLALGQWAEEKAGCPANQCSSSVMIIGCDDRKQRHTCTRGVRPWSYVGRFSSGCSGTLIGSRHVLTAAHCISSSSSPIGFSLGQFSVNNKPYGTQYVRRAIRPGEYGSGSSIAVKAFDYALVELWHGPPGGQAMPFGYVSWGNLRNASAYSIGFPGTTGTFVPKSIVEAGRQRFVDTPSSVRWRRGGDSGVLYTSIDAEGGQSGSPVYRINSSGRRVVGVLIGSPVSHCQLGRVWAARLTPGAVERINRWKAYFFSSTYPAVRYFFPYKSPEPASAPNCP